MKQAVISGIAALCVALFSQTASAQEPPPGVWDMQWSPDGAQLAIADADGLVYVVDATGSLVFTLSGHSHQVWAVAWSPDGQTIATGGYFDHFINIWKRSTRTLIRQVFSGTGEAYDGIYNIAWSPDGAYLLAAYFDRFQFWETNTWTALTSSQDGSLYDAEWSPDGVLFASTDVYQLAFFNGEAVVGGNLNGYFIQINGENPEQLSWSSDSHLIATTDRLDPRVSIWDVPTRTRIGVFTSSGALFKDVAFIGNDRVAVVTETGTLYLLDTTGNVLAAYETDVTEVRSLAWNPILGIFAIGGAHTTIAANGISQLPFVPLSAVVPSTAAP